MLKPKGKMEKVCWASFMDYDFTLTFVKINVTR